MRSSAASASSSCPGQPPRRGGAAIVPERDRSRRGLPQARGRAEARARCLRGPHSAQGYECNLAYDGDYAEIVRWNGPVGDYTYLSRGSVADGLKDGDTLSASIVGTSITLSVNGIVRVTATDSTFATGNPGMASWRGSNGCGTFGDYGFTHYSASSLP